MFKFIYELVKDPLGLPIAWYCEWIILAAINWFSYVFAYEKVGILYHGDFISGRTAGSLFCYHMGYYIYCNFGCKICSIS